MASIVSGIEFNVENDYVYTKARVNANGRKQIGILNKTNKKSFYMSTPLMLTWGVNTYTDEKTGEVQSYDMALQFPNDEYNNPDCITFLKNMQALELKLKADAISNSKDWLNKAKTTPDAIDALWSPMLKYPKDKETGEPDYSRSPTLKVKIPFWEGEHKNVELYNDDRVLLFPTDENDTDIGSLIVKGSNVATIIQCGGIWVANGKFGVTWKLFQAVVKPRVTLSGKCHITLSNKEKEQMHSNSVDEDEISDLVTKTHDTKVDDSDDDDSQVSGPPSSSVQEEVKAEITAKTVTTEDAPKKKRVVKKKSTTDE
tara:strand:- start:5510 stop:6451 length:942 start_codon:yes stop_codon:yes gene_type:complete